MNDLQILVNHATNLLYKKPSAILFDYDNTLVNSGPFISQALAATIAKFNLDQELIEALNIDFNQSMRNYFHLIFPDNLDKARQVYYDYYQEFSIDIKQFEGAENVLKFVKQKGIYTSLVSNKRGHILREEVSQRLGWQDYFVEIVGAGDVAEDKPSSIPAEFALQQAGLTEYQDVWLIGDSLIDLLTAQNLGCKAILYGNAEIAEKDQLSIYASVANHSELLNLLQRLYA